MSYPLILTHSLSLFNKRAPPPPLLFEEGGGAGGDGIIDKI